MRVPAVSLVLLAAVHADFRPDLRHIQPRGGPRGTEMTIRLHGERLGQPRALLFQRPGIEVISLEERVRTAQEDGTKREVRDGKVALAKIRIAPDAALGEHPVRLRTDGGVSYLRSFWVGQFPTVTEEEPNNDIESPQEISPNVTIQGVADTEDQDVFSIHLGKGDPLSVEVEAMRLGRVFFDARVAILDPDGFEVASCDDAPLLYTDAFVSIIAPEEADYRIVVREAAYQGGETSQYRLHVGGFPRPAAVFPPGARPGETIDFRFIGDPGGELVRSIPIPSDASGRFPLFVERDGVSSPSPNWIEVSPLPHLAEQEPNASLKEANSMPPAPSAMHGILATGNDTDWFRFRAQKNRNYDISVLARRLRSPVDSLISVRDAKGKYLGGNDDQDGPDSVLRWKCPADGDYHLTVRDKLGRGGPGFTYRVEIAPSAPAISAGLPVAERNNSQARKMICIPRGNSYATPVNLRRQNLGCAAAFEALSLPGGVTMEVPPVPRSLNNFPVLFRAAADAPIAGGYHRFRIRATGDKTPQVEGPLREEIHHIEVNNQGAYHSWTSDDIAVAVIEEAPFHVQLEAPPAPIVARGTVKLKVRVRRVQGFDAGINLRLLWKPPGIGAPETVPLAAKTDEALYEINASPDAPTGEWRLAVLGEAATPKGPVIVSSEFVTLRVVEPWLTASIDLGATEQGRDVPLVCQLEHGRDFTGDARAELVGLPHGASAEAQTFAHGTKQLTFPVKVAKDAAVGKHSGLFLRIRVPDGGGAVLHECGQGGTLRIDKPRAPVAGQKPEPAKKPDGKAPAKPLSRLEQLRRQAAGE